MNLQLPLFGRTGALTAALVLAMAIGVAACGGAASDDGGVVSLASPSGAPGESSSPAASVDPEEAMLAFEKCMKEHGIDLQVAVTTGGTGGPGVDVQVGGPGAGTEAQPAPREFDAKALEEADKACRDLLPASGMGDPGATIDPLFADQLLKFAQCMRDHGVDFPDPEITVNGGAVQAIGGGAAIDPTSKAFQDAQADCAKELPGGSESGGAPFIIGSGSSSSGEGGPAIEVKP
jgi:hypothetical protein